MLVRTIPAGGDEALAPARRRRFVLRSCDCRFTIECEDDEAAQAIHAVLGGLGATLEHAPPLRASIRYRVVREEQRAGFRVYARGATPVRLADLDELTFHLDKAITLALQVGRPDLYFLHAAAVAREGAVAVLAAPSGTGKSTLALSLLDRGYGYLSDELAPVNPRDLTVHAYPHALCLKAVPRSIPLPAATCQIGQRWHVPVQSAPSGLEATRPRPVAAFVFVHRRGTGPQVSPLSPARTAAHLMSSALNPLAHAAQGLDVALALAQSIPGFELDSSDLAAAGAALDEILRQPRYNTRLS